jgi:hypothetical protein
VVDHLKNYSVLIHKPIDRPAKLYGVQSLLRPFESNFESLQIPYIISTTLLPFKDKIIFDGTLLTLELVIPPEYLPFSNTLYKNLATTDGIIEQFR